MKRLWLCAMLLTLLAACSKSAIEESSIPVVDTPTLYAEIADESTSRTYLEQAKYMRWHADDEISAFLGNTLNQRYGFDGKTGANSGTFSQVSYQLGTGNPIEEIRAFYPYAASTSFDDIAGKVNYIFPKLQQYGEGDTYGQGANPMVATSSSTSDTFLYFRNICGFLKLQLYGDDVTVKAILVKGNQAEKLSGASVITAEYNTDPSVSMADEATEGVVLDCGEGVVLSEDANNPTLFWIAIPPTTFAGGFTITIKGDNGKGHIQSTTKQRVISRNEYLQMPAFAVVCNKEINEEDFQENAQAEEQVVIPNNQIWYTTISGLPDDITHASYSSSVRDPYDMFGANIVSHASQGDKIVITFDRDVTSFGDNDEYDASAVFGQGLRSVVLPNSITSIGKRAFEGCSSLTSITIGNGVKSIGENAFDECSSLISATIPDSVIEIGAFAFYGCSSLTSVTIGSGVKTISSSAFGECSSLSSVSYSSDVKAWCEIVFDSENANPLCNGGELSIDGSLVTDLVIPDGIEVINNYAFAHCSSLRTVTIGNGVESIGDQAFYGCNALTTVINGNSVRVIGSLAFGDCHSLSEFKGKFASGDGRCLIVDGTLNSFAPAGITSYKIPAGVIVIGGSTFYGCKNLQSIVIGNHVATIGSLAFYGCALKTVYCKSVTPPEIVYYPFSVVSSDFKIYVPASNDDSIISTYKSAPNWSIYQDYIVEEPK